MEKEAGAIKHILKYVYGECLELHGVKALTDYSDTVLNIKLGDCYLSVKGSGFKVELLNIESGDLKVSGRIASLNYSHSREKINLFKRLIK